MRSAKANYHPKALECSYPVLNPQTCQCQ
ncbi:MAG: hypothetical protein DCF22_21655 [Leptolyngbya sp.]|nr:MAG: hypothetical protein DCF22_21655 [Leptolyngbya sp.]